MAEARSSGEALVEVRASDCLGRATAPPARLDRRRDSLILALSRRDAAARSPTPGSSVTSDIDAVDREVSAGLNADITAHGFPRGGTLSHEAHGGLLAIIWHNARRDSASWYGFLPQLKRALANGAIRPPEYAQLVDAYAVRKVGAVQVYNTVGEGQRSSDVDGARLSIGLRPDSWDSSDVLRHCG